MNWFEGQYRSLPPIHEDGRQAVAGDLHRESVGGEHVEVFFDGVYVAGRGGEGVEELSQLRHGEGLVGMPLVVAWLVGFKEGFHELFDDDEDGALFFLFHDFYRIE